MTLIKCKECGKDVSDNVENCIHCGYMIKNHNMPMKEKNLGLAIAGFVCALSSWVVLAIVGGILGVIFGSIAISNNPQQNKAKSFGIASLSIGIFDILLWLIIMSI